MSDNWKDQKTLITVIEQMRRQIDQLLFYFNDHEARITNNENTLSQSFPVSRWDDDWPPNVRRVSENGHAREE